MNLSDKQIHVTVQLHIDTTLTLTYSAYYDVENSADIDLAYDDALSHLRRQADRLGTLPAPAQPTNGHNPQPPTPDRPLTEKDTDERVHFDTIYVQQIGGKRYLYCRGGQNYSKHGVALWPEMHVDFTAATGVNPSTITAERGDVPISFDGIVRLIANKPKLVKIFPKPE